jgi:hypothetical protein
MESTPSDKPKTLLICLLVAGAASTRLIDHPDNFTAIGAMALFSGALFSDRRLAFLLPMLTMLLTDAILGFHSSMLPVYGCLLITVFVGIKIQKYQNPFSIITASILCSILFFLVTNLPFWYVDISLYPMTWSGTMESYNAAIPFFWRQLAGDLFYNTILFGGYYLFQRQFATANS